MSIKTKNMSIKYLYPKYVTFCVGFVFMFVTGTAIAMLDPGPIAFSFYHEPAINE